MEPYWHYIPFNVGMGNHESLGWVSDTENWVVADGFPYETHSGEAVFAQMFANPLNGPRSEDGAKYDPDPYKRGDFPSYSENVYHYRYGNTVSLRQTPYPSTRFPPLSVSRTAAAVARVQIFCNLGSD